MKRKNQKLLKHRDAFEDRNETFKGVSDDDDDEDDVGDYKFNSPHMPVLRRLSLPIII